MKDPIVRKPAVEKKQEDEKAPSEVIYILLVACGILLSIIVRIRLLDIPLERDEGEFGYVAQIIMRGDSPFLGYNYKIPGVSYLYAFFMSMFGQTTEAIHLGLLITNVLTTVLLYLAIRKWKSPLAASVSAFTYAVLSVDSSVLGLAAHATHFVDFFVVAALCILLNNRENKTRNYSMAGILMGFAFIMKQPAVAFIMLGGIYILIELIKQKQFNLKTLFVRELSYGVAAMIPYCVIVLIALSFHHFDLFWKWTYVYPLNYGSILSRGEGWDNLEYIFPFVISNYYWAYWFGLLSLALIFIRKDISKYDPLFLLIYLIFAFLAIAAGLYFRSHYFIMLLPLLAICIGLGFDSISHFLQGFTRFSKAISVGLFAGAGIYYIIEMSFLFFTIDPFVYSKRVYGENPFVEAVEIAKFVDQNTNPTDKIAVLGSEAEIYFYTKRTAATGYLFMYDLVSKQPKNVEMQNEFIAEIEKNKPKVMVLSAVYFSWIRNLEAPDSVFKWMDTYTRAHYQIIGVAECLPNSSNYHLNEQLNGYQLPAANYLTVYKRNNEPEISN